jgi:hypothetical protein
VEGFYYGCEVLSVCITRRFVGLEQTSRNAVLCANATSVMADAAWLGSMNDRGSRTAVLTVQPAKGSPHERRRPVADKPMLLNDSLLILAERFSVRHVECIGRQKDPTPSSLKHGESWVAFAPKKYCGGIRAGA